MTKVLDISEILFLGWLGICAAGLLAVLVHLELGPMVRILVWLRMRKAVYIQDFDGEVRVQFLRFCPIRGKGCHRNGSIGTAILLDDGSVGQPSYVKAWYPYPYRKPEAK